MAVLRNRGHHIAGQFLDRGDAMRVFVAGATGVIGRPLVRRLVAAGHRVTGMTRFEEKADGLTATGVEAVVCNAFDGDGLTRAVVAARPDVVVHLLTDIPKSIDPRRYADQMAGNDLLRRQGTRNLMEAARRGGVRRVLAESISFAYAPSGDLVKDEDASLYLDAPEPFRATVDALIELEEQVLWAGDVEGLVLRYGRLYGPGTVYAPGGQVAELVRRRRFPIVGDGGGIYSFLHAEDAAEATALAVTRGAPGVYNVVDDQPAPVNEWLPAYAAALGAPRPRRVPAFVARIVTGSMIVESMTEERGASNSKARGELGWEPSYASWRSGFEEALA
jgi:nucleoside-diphosphate-sugar epimerase